MESRSVGLSCVVRVSLKQNRHFVADIETYGLIQQQKASFVVLSKLRLNLYRRFLSWAARCQGNQRSVSCAIFVVFW